MKKLQPGDRFNRFQAKKKARKVVKDPNTKKIAEQLTAIAKEMGTSLREKVAIRGLI